MLEKIHLYLNDGFEINQAVWNSSVCYIGNLHSELMQIIHLGAFCFLSSTEPMTESFSTVLLHASINVGHFLTKRATLFQRLVLHKSNANEHPVFHKIYF